MSKMSLPPAGIWRAFTPERGGNEGDRFHPSLIFALQFHPEAGSDGGFVLALARQLGLDRRKEAEQDKRQDGLAAFDQAGSIEEREE